MRITIKKISTYICVTVCLFSMTGCFFNPFKRSSGKSKSDNGLTYEEAADILLKEYSVQDYSGTVPDGMEIKYVVFKEVYMDNNKNRRVYEYDYDKAGRQTVLIDYGSFCTVKHSITFNDDGTVAKKEFKKLTKDYGHSGNEYVAEYKYNDSKQLVSYTVTEEDYPAVTCKFEYENGHLISGEIYDNNRKYDYSTSGQYYDYFAKVWEGFDYGYLVVPVKRIYADDTFEKVLMEEDYQSVMLHYEYDGDVMTGWYYVDDLLRAHKYDAKGNFLGINDKDGNCLKKWEYNKYGDLVLREDYKDGELIKKSITTYDYDDKGNKLYERTVYGNPDGGEGSYVSTVKYNYDEYGLLKSKVQEIDGKFYEMTVYAYKAIIVPIE